MSIRKNLALVFFCLVSCGQSDKNAWQGYVEGENIYLASPYSGVLENLAVHRGQSVKKGQLLFKLDLNPQILAVRQYTGELEQANHQLLDLQNPRRPAEIDAIRAQIEETEAALQLAKLRVERRKELYDRHAIDRESVDEALSLLKQREEQKKRYLANLALARLGSREEQIKAQKAMIDALVARLKEARWEVAQKQVNAPAAGAVFDTYYRPGEFVAAAQPVLSLLTPENVRIEFFVPVRVLDRLEVGKKISFLCDGCEKQGEAVISYISPEAQFVPPLVYSRDNSEKLVFRIKASLADPGQYKPGQPVRVFLP